MHIYAPNYIWQRSRKCSKDEHIKSSPVSTHTTLYCLAYCSVFIIRHDDFASDCCASGTSSAIYIREQHKIIAVCLSVSQGYGSSSTLLWDVLTCSRVCFLWEKCKQHTYNNHNLSIEVKQCYINNYIYFFEPHVACFYLLAGLNCQSSFDLAYREIKIMLVQNGSDHVPQSSLAISIHPFPSPFCPNLSFSSFSCLSYSFNSLSFHLSETSFTLSLSLSSRF